MNGNNLTELLEGMTLEMESNQRKTSIRPKTHTTVEERRIHHQRHQVKTLVDTCLVYLAHHSHAIVDIKGR